MAPNAIEELAGVEGIGPVVAEAIVDFFAEQHNREALEKLEAQVRIEPMEAIAQNHPLAGKTIVFTGSLEKMTRDEAKALAERLAQKSPARFRKKRPRRRRSRRRLKFAKARDLGVETIDGYEWLTRSGRS